MFTTWLVFQLAGIGTSVMLAASEATEEVCTCPGGAKATTCPMHHGGGSRGSAAHHGTAEGTPTDETNSCALTSTNPPANLALLGLTAGAGILPRGVVIDGAAPICGRAVMPSTNPSFRSELPDLPPPRV